MIRIWLSSQIRRKDRARLLVTTGRPLLVVKTNLVSGQADPRQPTGCPDREDHPQGGPMPPANGRTLDPGRPQQSSSPRSHAATDPDRSLATGEKPVPSDPAADDRPHGHCPRYQAWAYVIVSLLTGLRNEEVRALRWDHVVAWVDGQWWQSACG